MTGPTVPRLAKRERLADVTISACGGLDEHTIGAMIAAGAPIDGFGVGTSPTTSSDAPKG